jgi:hypothetical protein
MASKTDRVVASHRLEHLGPLRVDPEIFTARFSRACSMANCDAGCCQGGVWVDVLHRDVILEHAAVIARHMDPEQEHNPARWFEGEIADDSDFPSGKAVGTEVTDSGCVFLNAHRRCVLHAVDDVENLGVRLKPFFCRVFPVTICNGVLTLDEPIAGERPQCCSETPGGGQTVLELCEEEWGTALGEQGVAELRMLARDGHE